MDEDCCADGVSCAGVLATRLYATAPGSWKEDETIVEKAGEQKM